MFEIIRKKGESKDAKYKIGLSADEIKLMENIEYNKQIGEYTGFVNLGKYTPNFYVRTISRNRSTIRLFHCEKLRS